METGIGRNTSGMIEDLVKNAPSYNVWQAVWIGENLTRKEHPARKDYLLDQSGLKFRPDERYVYPPNDIRSISYENGNLNFVLTFMGLYGINSPLPRCYHEQVALQQRILGSGDVPLQNFLDIFNNRFYWLYYNSWKKYRFFLYFRGEQENKIKVRIHSFMGRSLFTKKANYLIPDLALLKCSGLFSQRARNKSGLKILLNHLFPRFNMKIKEFIPRWVELSDIPELGSDENRLGSNNFLGKTAVDYSSRICIEIGPIDFQEYKNFLPGKHNANKLTEILKLYLNDGIEFDFKFKIISSTINSVSWNDEGLALGSTFWLGKPDKDNVEVYVHYEEIEKNI